jgi:hypothetical protein
VGEGCCKWILRLFASEKAGRGERREKRRGGKNRKEGGKRRNATWLNVAFYEIFFFLSLLHGQ